MRVLGAGDNVVEPSGAGGTAAGGAGEPGVAAGAGGLAGGLAGAPASVGTMPVAAAPAPGPNSPVGVMWMGLSKPHYGIHGTPEPGSISKTQSNGCIRMTNWSVLQVSEAVSRGTPVTLIP